MKQFENNSVVAELFNTNTTVGDLLTFLTKPDLVMRYPVDGWGHNKAEPFVYFQSSATRWLFPL